MPDVQPLEVRTIDRIKKWFSFNSLTILGEHYRAIKEQINPVSEAERHEVKYLSKEFERYYKKTVWLSHWRAFFYVLLYATFFTSVLKVIPFLKYLVEFIDIGNALIGSGIAIVLIFFFTIRINLNIVRMQGAMMHLVAIYSTNKKRDSKKALQRISRVI